METKMITHPVPTSLKLLVTIAGAHILLRFTTYLSTYRNKITLANIRIKLQRMLVHNNFRISRLIGLLETGSGNRKQGHAAKYHVVLSTSGSVTRQTTPIQCHRNPALCQTPI